MLNADRARRPRPLTPVVALLLAGATAIGMGAALGVPGARAQAGAAPGVAADVLVELRRTLTELRRHPQAEAGAGAMHDADAALARAAKQRAPGGDAVALARERDLAEALVFLAGRQIELAAARMRRDTAERQLQAAQAAATTARGALDHARRLLQQPPPPQAAQAPEASPTPEAP